MSDIETVPPTSSAAAVAANAMASACTVGAAPIAVTLDPDKQVSHLTGIMLQDQEARRRSQ